MAGYSPWGRGGAGAPHSIPDEGSARMGRGGMKKNVTIIALF